MRMQIANLVPQWNVSALQMQITLIARLCNTLCNGLHQCQSMYAVLYIYALDYCWLLLLIIIVQYVQYVIWNSKIVSVR